MTDDDCAAFLRWALPRLGLRWQGYRRVRRQVCKRIARRMRALGIGELGAYRRRLERCPAEWAALDPLCIVTISRFWRDRAVFDHLARHVLPALAAGAGDGRLRAWSAGSASGEEPYSLRLLWDLEVGPRHPGATLEIVATEMDAALIARARAGRYPGGALNDVPAAWRERAFERAGRDYVLAARHRRGVRYRRQDIRRAMPEGPFDLVLCRNLAFTYFAEPLQRGVLAGIARRLRPEGALVLGRGERLPGDAADFVRPAPGLPIYRRIRGRRGG